jgi:hypothetical protein
MPDEKLIKMIVEGSTAIVALILLFKLFVIVLSMWKDQQATQQIAFNKQREEHGVQTDLLKGAHNKLDVLVKGVHR